MLGVIGRFYATDGNPNVLTIKGERYFFERGREQGDGAVTGSLMLMLPNDYCRKIGSVRINPDGTIGSFPKMPKVDRQECENTRRDMAARNPQLLHAWACGRI